MYNYPYISHCELLPQQQFPDGHDRQQKNIAPFESRRSTAIAVIRAAVLDRLPHALLEHLPRAESHGAAGQVDGVLVKHERHLIPLALIASTAEK